MVVLILNIFVCYCRVLWMYILEPGGPYFRLHVYQLVSGRALRAARKARLLSLLPI